MNATRNHTSSQSLAEHWNSSRWAIQATPVPAGAGTYSLDRVACPEAGFCLATGTASQTSAHTPTAIAIAIAIAIAEIWAGQGWAQQTLPLAEYWTGTSWAIQPTAPVPACSALSDVSCTAPRICTAVGNIGDDQLLAETRTS